MHSFLKERKVELKCAVTHLHRVSLIVVKLATGKQQQHARELTEGGAAAPWLRQQACQQLSAFRKLALTWRVCPSAESLRVHYLIELQPHLQSMRTVRAVQ